MKTFLKVIGYTGLFVLLYGIVSDSERTAGIVVAFGSWVGTIASQVLTFLEGTLP